jgi:hypothetical protein
MHVHSNVINPNAQLDALSSVQRAEGKREAARVRKKLLEIASELTGEAEFGEACVVKLGTREESEDQRKQEQQNSRTKEKEQTDSEIADSSISDWT